MILAAATINVSSDLTVILAYSGLLTVGGSIIAAAVRSRSRKGEARAHAADMLAEGFGSFTEDLQEDNTRLRSEVDKMHRDAIKVHRRVRRLTSAVEALLESPRRGALNFNEAIDVELRDEAQEASEAMYADDNSA